MIMRHPDYPGETCPGFQRTGPFSDMRRHSFPSGLEAQRPTAAPSESRWELRAGRAVLLGRAGLVLLFILAIVLRSLW